MMTIISCIQIFPTLDESSIYMGVSYNEEETKLNPLSAEIKYVNGINWWTPPCGKFYDPANLLLSTVLL